MTNRKKKSLAKSPISETGARADDSSAQRDQRAGEYIRMRAYELYLERGNGPRDELGDWLRAEQEQTKGESHRSILGGGELSSQESRP